MSKFRWLAARWREGLRLYGLPLALVVIAFTVWGGRFEPVLAALVGSLLAMLSVTKSSAAGEVKLGVPPGVEGKVNDSLLERAQVAANFGCWEVDSEWNLKLSTPLKRILGLGDVGTTSLSQLVLPEDLKRGQSAWHDMLRGEVVGQLELRFLRPDGTERLLRVSGDVVVDSSGTFVSAAGIGQDVTEQREAEERHRLLSKTVQEAVARFNSEGRCVYMSSAGARLFECPREQLVGANLRDLLQREHRAQVCSLFQEVASGQLPCANVDARIHRPTSTALWVELRLHTWTPGAVLIAWRDVSEKKKWEERYFQSQKMEAIGRLAGGVAHDFNNLLQVILGNLELVCLAMDDASPQKPVLEEIQQAGQRAAELTSRLLTFSRRDASVLRQVDVNETLQQLQPLLLRVIGENIALQFDFADNLQSVMADSTQLQQILLNLVVNARDAMPAGGRLWVATGCSARAPGGRAGNFVTLTVTDSGTGIDPEVRPFIFEPFFTTKPGAQGTGLGLATVYGLVHQWEGEVEVDSLPGRGSTFRVYLPITSEAADIFAPQPAEASPGAHTANILLVEDDDNVRLQIARQLKSQGHAVHEACDGRAGLALDCPRPDLLIADVVMPHCNGHEMAQQMCARYPSLKVLYITGYADDWLRGAGVEAGSSPVLRKPFSLKELDNKIVELLQG